MLLQKRHDTAIEFEFVMGHPCPVTGSPPKEPEEAPSSPPSQGLLLCAKEERYRCGGSPICWSVNDKSAAESSSAEPDPGGFVKDGRRNDER